VKHRQTASRWQLLSERQRQRITADCFRLQMPTDISVSTDDALPVNTKPDAGKKMHQRKRMRAERASQAK